MADFDGIIQPSADWVDVPSLSTTAIALGGASGAGIMNAQASAIVKRTNYLYNYSIQYNPATANVGIGTSTASSKLEIVASSGVAYSTLSTNSPAPFSIAQLSQSSNSINAPSLFNFYTTYGGGNWYIGAVSTGGYKTPFVFGSRIGANSFTEIARFDASNGNFGIGTSNPNDYGSAYKTMTISAASSGLVQAANSTTSTISELGTTPDSNGGYVGTRSNHNFSIKTNNVSTVFFDTTGNVGIGTLPSGTGTGFTSREGKLVILQNVANQAALMIPYSSATLYAGFKIVHGNQNSSGAVDYTDFKIRPAYASGVASGADVSFIRVVNTQPRNFADVNLCPDGGSVGVGINPSIWTSYKSIELAINGSALYANTSEIGLVYGSNYNGGWKYGVSSVMPTRYASTAGTHIFQNAVAGTSGNALTWTESVRIDTTGNLLVGTTGTSYAQAGRKSIEVNGTSDSVIGLKTNGTARGYIQATNTNDIIVGNNSISNSVKVMTGSTVVTTTTSTGMVVNGLTKTTTSNGFGFGGQFKNLFVAMTTGGLLLVQADFITLNDIDYNSIVLKNVSITEPTPSSTLDLGGNFAANTWYAIYLVYSTNQGVVTPLKIVTSLTDIGADAIYTYRTRIGWLKTNASGGVNSFIQRDNRVQLLPNTESDVITIVTGPTPNNSTVLTSVTVRGNHIPTTASDISVRYTQSVIATAYGEVGPTAIKSLSFYSYGLGSAQSYGESTKVDMMLVTNSIWWRTNSTDSLKLIGWIDSI